MADKYVCKNCGEELFLFDDKFIHSPFGNIIAQDLACPIAELRKK